MTNARERGWARLELTEPLLSVHVCLCRCEQTVLNFFILDEGCPILTWRWCFLLSRQTVRYPQKSGSHLALITRCSRLQNSRFFPQNQ